jgi:hypothetical protein
MYSTLVDRSVCTPISAHRDPSVYPYPSAKWFAAPLALRHLLWSFCGNKHSGLRCGAVSTPMRQSHAEASAPLRMSVRVVFPSNTSVVGRQSVALNGWSQLEQGVIL